MTASSSRALPVTAAPRRAVSRRGASIVVAAVATKTVKIGTRGSPLALAQAYMTRDLLKVRFRVNAGEESRRERGGETGRERIRNPRAQSSLARSLAFFFLKPSLSFVRPNSILIFFFLNLDPPPKKKKKLRLSFLSTRPPSPTSRRTAPSRSASSRPRATRSSASPSPTSAARASSPRRSTTRCSTAASTSRSTR